ncbi:BON domain-containing protein [Hymenobacter sp. J193]|uniref:BON domain-containing protein n=1 Tax=Hymenobacter sp. J193 TaxID=2898429 RepID=UPI0021512874|nr:BON domain-containing protein [Hymenobacter sp. J193]MCR5889519.1 BON domain-containing protein [Hymenobacter sp. J193]
MELTGFTDSLLSRERAEDMAKAVRGVRGVIDEISIRTPDVPDEVLQQRVEQALAQDPAAGTYALQCSAHDGEITLDGSVQSWAEQQLVLRVVFGVPGVRRLQNRLLVQGGVLNNTDEEITNQIREFLAWDIRVKSTLIDIRTDHGVVHITGTVGTAAEHAHVVATAYVAGAARVDARDLFIAYWAVDKELRRQKFAPKADEDMAQAIRDTLRYDPRVDFLALTVHVRDGEVTLLGAMSNLKSRHAAEQDARNVVGVGQVHNLLQVRVQNPAPDEFTLDQVQTALAADLFVGRYTFVVKVNDGLVQLYGTVATHFDLERAADVVTGISGMVALTNHVQIVPEKHEPAVAEDTAAGVGQGHAPFRSLEPDHLLQQRIRYHYAWSALLHDQDITIDVRKGRVTLTGTVDTLLDRKSAAVEAYNCGAQDVNNHLRLTPLLSQPQAL